MIVAGSPVTEKQAEYIRDLESSWHKSEKERDEARADVEALKEWRVECSKLRVEIASLHLNLKFRERQAERFAAALLEYGEHSPNCASLDPQPEFDGYKHKPCSCGLKKALGEEEA